MLRIPIGVASDRFGARRTFSALLVMGAAAVFGLSYAGSFAAFLIGGLALGMVGTTFVVGVQSVSSWTPAARQGLGLGIFGAGNVGTAVTTLAMPALLVQLGWRQSFQLYAAMLLVTAIAYAVVVRDAPRTGPARPAPCDSSRRRLCSPSPGSTASTTPPASVSSWPPALCSATCTWTCMACP